MITIGSDTNFTGLIGIGLSILGFMAVVDGDYEAGQRLGYEALAYTPPNWEYHNPAERTLCLAALGLNDAEQARQRLRQALQILSQQFQHLEAVQWFATAVPVLAHTGKAARAVELLALVRPQPEDLIGWLDRWQLLIDLQRHLKAELGAETYDAAWKHGETLDVETETRRLLVYLGEEPATEQAQANANLPESLTERELEVLSLLAQGRSNRQIAQELVIAVNTVKRYVYDICQKLEANNRTHAVARARELGLFT